MKSLALSAVVLTSTVSALPKIGLSLSLGIGLKDSNYWKPPGPGDVRAPCPGVSVLANHGFINRNGKGITANDLQKGFLDAFNVGYDVTATGAQNTINLCTSQLAPGSSPCTFFDINVLDIPHAFEHDGSMRTQDKGMFGGEGNNEVFNATIMSQTKAIWGSAPHYSYQLAETVRRRRNEQQIAADDPDWFQENALAGHTEQAFTLSSMKTQDPTADTSEGNARLDWIEYWFVNTRLPTDIGWSKPTTTIYQSQIASMTDAMKAVTTIAQATTTAVNLVPQQTRAPFPYNPYQDTIIPADFLQNVIGGVVGLIPNALNVNLTI